MTEENIDVAEETEILQQVLRLTMSTISVHRDRLQKLNC